jgi:ABC-type multidrug transport system fused ATPase/permease subunit
MKLLLQAAIRNSRHVTLSILTVLSLLFLTIANQCEISALGIMTNTGADFFSLFSPQKKVENKIHFDDVVQKWSQIDHDHDGYITRQEASLYLSERKDGGPLSWILHKFSANFDLERNFSNLVLVLVFIAIFKAITLFTSRYFTQLLSIRITRDLRQQYFEHIQSLPLSFYQEQNLGSLSTRAVGDASQIAASLNSCLTNYLQTPFILISTLFLCFALSWKLSLIIFLGTPLIVFPVMILTKKVKSLSRQLQKNQEHLSSVLLDFLGGIQTVKLYAMEAFSLRKYKLKNDEMAELESKSAKYGMMTRPLLHLIATTCLAVVVLFGLYVLNMNISQLIMFCALLHMFYEPVKKFAEENNNIQKGVVAAERMFEVLNLRSQIQDLPGAVDLKEFKHKIEFDRVWFKYGDEWILKNLSFSVEKGQSVAIVGATGAGKSTIVQLLPRLYEPQQGDIKIDGLSIREITQKSLRELISIVPQKPFLFYDTVSENISFGRAFPLEEVIEASKQAHAHEFISELPQQYNTFLAEMGKTLSGGQQQRLAIARALVKKAPILILDEATSSLDAISEHRIKTAIQEMKGTMTQVIIAHRLSTIEQADKIIYLENGEKVGEGPIQELIRTCSGFRHLWSTYKATSVQKNPLESAEV